ncbi:membrane protein [Arthrobacter phage Tokki]|nr:membrane protein [Arthrobacter phage Tokki]
MTEVDNFLLHYGVKGMKWGRRKDRPEGESRISPEQKAKLKKAAIVVGTAAVVGAITIGAIYVSNNSGMKVPAKIDTKAAEDFVKSKLQEPSGVVHATRSKHKGFSIYESGGLSEPLNEYTKAFGSNSDGGEIFKRYGDSNEKVAVRFYDPEGRKDRSGRVIPHEVILPAPLAKDVTDLSGAISKVWPMIKDTVEAKYDPEANRD